MKKTFTFIILLALFYIPLKASEQLIRVSTHDTDLILKVNAKGRLYQTYLGAKLRGELNSSVINIPLDPKGWEVYPVSGGEDYFEPALAVQHNDGNMTSYLYYQSHTTQRIDDNVEHTIIKMADTVYPLEVTLHYQSFKKENVIKTWTEIKHDEKKPLNMSQYASSMLYFERPVYYLTEYSGDWARELRMSTEKLNFGKKILDTKLGTRAAMHTYPFFQVGMGAEATEDAGEVLLGTLGWTGNFRFTLEVDNNRNLRVISGINPYASNYYLNRNEVFKTPEFIFTLSQEGMSKASKDIHDWARNYQVKDGNGDRRTLLNNWEATFFDFDENKLAEVMQDAQELGVDMFLLDDGWFANKYPRNHDRAGLGDWEPMKSKLPHGIPGLVDMANKAGVQFGIWIEPEMVNPKSELYEKHPDWVIEQPNRETYYFRNQLVLDLSNPKVQDHVYGVLDHIVKENPAISYFKWDCNSPITNIYSPYLKEKQSHLYIDHIRGLYKVLERVKKDHPDVSIMLCSGGGARCDYEALKYFTEFWCSDNTDPVERLFIQWNFSKFFPIKTMAAHVTSWNKDASIKFRTDVAMMCKFGFDISLNSLNQEEREFCKEAVVNYKRLKPTILDGDFYRLVSPYEYNHTAVMHVSKDKKSALVYVYDIFPRYDEKLLPIQLKGIDANKNYSVKEINLMPGTHSELKGNDQVYSGDYLLKVGLYAFTTKKMNSKLIELKLVE